MLKSMPATPPRSHHSAVRSVRLCGLPLNLIPVPLIDDWVRACAWCVARVVNTQHQITHHQIAGPSTLPRLRVIRTLIFLECVVSQLSQLHGLLSLRLRPLGLRCPVGEYRC